MNELPQYRKLYEILRKQVLSGTYGEGSLLPSENELSGKYGLTRLTVRQALEALVKDGLIYKRQGKGSIVLKPLQNIGILSVEGTSSAIGIIHLKTDILQPPVIRKWEDDFAFEITETERECGCIYMERLRFVDDKPLFYDINHIPDFDLPGFTRLSFENRSLFDTLRTHYQIQVTGGEQRLKAIRAPEQIASVLKIRKGNPVLFLERKLNTSRENFHVFSTIWFNSTKHAILGVF